MERPANDLLRVVDKGGTEHHLNLANVADISFDRQGKAVILTSAVRGEVTHAVQVVERAEVDKLHTALVRREDLAEIPAS